MFFQLLFIHPISAIAWFLASIFSFTIHEFGHAFATHLLGDETAEREGRLTLNPLSHVDPIGLLMLLMAGFGWAKPVPFTPSNLKHPRLDSMLIGLAGPFANVILAAIAAIIFRFMGLQLSGDFFSTFLFVLVVINLLLVVFNAIPIPPLDGSKLLFAVIGGAKKADLRAYIALRGPQILLLIVAVSLLTKWNPFGFISSTAFYLCDIATRIGCSSVLNTLITGA
ncbi:site-2 protease family protein [Patescibacteria group bacterium]|nr:site-2 protease family protein [Patescibacteria group bacterium]